MTGASEVPRPRGTRVRPTEPRVRPTEPRVRNPYVGPRAFEEGESELFFGRDQEVEILAGQVLARRASLLFAPSGAGKSSLLQAGLIPELTRQETVGRGQWERTYQKMRVLPILTVGGLVPATAQRPIANVYVFRALLSLVPDSDPEDLAGRTLADGLAPFFPSPEPPDSQHPGLATSQLSTLLVFDQFEELFTWDPTRHQEREDFFRQVNQALEAYPTLHVLFSMREDYIAELTPYAALLPEQLRPRFRLEFLGEEAARLAIQQPARTADVEFTDGAAAKLVDDLRRVRVQRLDGTMDEQVGAYVEPVQLQVVCRRLWDKLPSGATQVTVADVEAVGDVDSALAGYYAERVAAIAAETSVPERAIRDWCDRQLITEQGIRGQVLQGRERSQGLDNRAIWPLVDAHLVRAEKRRGATWFELAHDRLIEPVRRDNAQWRAAKLNTLQRQAGLWNAAQRPDGLLLRGQELAEAERWATDHARELEDFERDFLTRSQERRKVETRQKILVVALAVMFILAVVAAVFSWIQAGIARQQQATAVAALNMVATADSRAGGAEQTAAVSQNDAAEAQSQADQFQATARAAGTVASAQQRWTADALQATADTAQGAADQLRRTAEVAGTAAAAAQQTAAAEREMAITAVVTLQPTPLPTDTPTATPSLTPSPTTTSTPRPTATPSPRPIATTQPKPPITPMPITCAAEPVGEFLAIWQGLKERLGCPRQTQPTEWTPMAKQRYERGFMFWSQQPTNLVLAVVPASQGGELAWYEFRAWSFVPGSALCASQFSPGPGQIRPINAFGGVWCDNKAVRDVMGWAVATEQSIQGAVQEFDQGFVLRDETGQVWVLLRSSGLQVGMARIQGGTLQMGSPEGEGDADERPERQVLISDFWMDLTEVTNREYRACEAARVCKAPHQASGQLQVDSASRPRYHTDPIWDRYPVIFVSWSEAKTYCEWLGKRLPTEAEWEWAAGGSDGRRYPWGTQEPDDSRARFQKEPRGDTVQVGSYAAGANGLYDMAGNVWEWTSSLYVPYPYRPGDGRENPTAAGKRVLRGGSWRDGPGSLRTANRDAGTEPDFPLDNVGFRCARTAD